MKVLFVCVANVGRSQVAEAWFNKLSVHDSVSAGTQADEIVSRTNPPSRMLKDAGSQGIPILGIPLMKHEGVDISERSRDQLTPTMVHEADRVIVMANRDSWPDYLGDSGKVTHWEIADPVGMDEHAALSIYDEIKRQVQELVRETG